MAGRFRGDLLARAREAAGQSQSELALAIGVSTAERIARWERGEEQPRPQFIPLLGELVAVAPIELLDGDPKSPDLARLRLAAGLTVVELAERVGLSKMTYNRIERGTPVQRLSPDTVKALAKTLNVPVGVAEGLLPQRG